MNNYSIDSIQITYCSKTMPHILNLIELCQNCNLIPLPPYRSSKQSNIIFCKACYLSHYKNFDYNVIPSKSELKLMDQIVFSCKFFSQGCNEEFSIHTLQNLLFHQQKCKSNPTKTNFTGIKRLRHANQIMKTEIEIIHDQLNIQALSFQEQSQKLQDTIKSQAKDIIHLKKTVQDLKKYMDNQISLIINKFNDKLDSQAIEISNIKQSIPDQQNSIEIK